MKTSMTMLIVTIAISSIITSAQGQNKLPNVVSVEQRLADEIAKMITAGHLHPLDANCTEHYWKRRTTWGDLVDIYWHNPAETIYTLLRALKYVPESMKPGLRAYIQSEWEFAPPSQYTHAGWQGANRQYADVPPSLQEFWTTGPGTPGGLVPSKTSWTGWTFDPFNYYACWLYAKEFGGAGEILSTLPAIKAVPADTLTNQFPHILNSYIAGYHGYLGLQELAGQTLSTQVQGWLSDAKQKRALQLKTNPHALNPVEAGGFKYIVPELGKYLHDNALADLTAWVDEYGRNTAPMWFIAGADEVTRIDGGTAFSEGSTSHYYEYWSLFQAKALAVQEPRENLELYLDGPVVNTGDLYYIQNMVSTIDAGDYIPLEIKSPANVNMTGRIQSSSAVFDLRGRKVWQGAGDIPSSIRTSGLLIVRSSPESGYSATVRYHILKK